MTYENTSKKQYTNTKIYIYIKKTTTTPFILLSSDQSLDYFYGINLTALVLIHFFCCFSTQTLTNLCCQHDGHLPLARQSGMFPSMGVTWSETTDVCRDQQGEVALGGGGTLREAGPLGLYHSRMTTGLRSVTVTTSGC